MLSYARMLLGRTAASSALDTQQVTSGASGTAVAQDRTRGFISGAIGSCSDATSNLYGGAAIRALYWDENGGTPADLVAFQVSGVQANSGWTTMTIGAVAFSRASATFSTAGGNSSWTWPNTGYSASTNPFGGNGSNHSVTFT